MTVSAGSELYWLAARRDTVYVSYRNLTTNMYRRRSFDGGLSWEGESVWPSFAYGAMPVALGPAGRIHCLYLRYYYPTGYAVLYLRSKNAGTTWSDSSDVSTLDALLRYPRAIAVSNGNVHALWEDYVYGNYEIFYRRGTELAGLDGDSRPSPLNPEVTLCIAPSVSNQHVVLNYSLPPEVRDARIDICDVLGRLVRTFGIPSSSSATSGAFVWPGTSGRVRAVAAGCYICTLKAGKWRAQTKVLLTR
jgi:hypothetical protein